MLSDSFIRQYPEEEPINMSIRDRTSLGFSSSVRKRIGSRQKSVFPWLLAFEFDIRKWRQTFAGTPGLEMRHLAFIIRCRNHIREHLRSEYLSAVSSLKREWKWCIRITPSWDIELETSRRNLFGVRFNRKRDNLLDNNYRTHFF